MRARDTCISPDLEFITDENGVEGILHNGEIILTGSTGLDHAHDLKEIFGILNALIYRRKDWGDGHFGYWASFRNGSEFWVAGRSLYEVIDQAAIRVAMYLAGRNGYPLFNGILNLNGVK